MISTRARDDRSAAGSAGPHRAAPPRPGHGGAATAGPASTAAPVHGANAVQIGYAAQPASSARPASYARPGEHFPVPAPRPAPDRRAAGGLAAPDRVTATPPAPVIVPRMPVLLSVIGVVVAGVVGLLVLTTTINENAFRLDDLRRRQAVLDVTEQQVTQDLAERESPGSLAAAARRLGLVPAGTPAFIRLPDGRVVGVPQPAAGQAGAPAGQAGDPGR